MARRSKAEVAYFKCQLQKRDEQLACEDSDDESVFRGKIERWAAQVHPDHGEGDPPKPRRTLSAPRPIVHLFSSSQTASAVFRPLKRRRPRTSTATSGSGSASSSL